MELPKYFRLFGGILFLALVFFSAFLYWNYFSVQDVVIYKMDAYIAEPSNAGFNLDPDMLHFGQVAITSPEAYREINFISPYDEDARIEVHASGDMAKYISYRYLGEYYAYPYSFTLKPNESTALRVILSFNSSEVEVGQHLTGELQIISHKTFFGF